ncbi:MAG TPA: ferritin-like domain-containing protein [Candidatus Acidoferrales bacterium]
MPDSHDSAASESASWRHYFLSRAAASDPLPWNDPTALTREEAQCIQSSIQQFQLGEGSSGRRLLKRGQDYATADPHFVDALALFVKEEQRHSAYLLRFMQRESIPAASSHWVDTVFRRLRVLAGLELSLRVLVSAEIIAIPYYRALGAATRSPLLQAICDRILKDEAAHLRFQTSMISRVSARRLYFADRIVSKMHRLFLLITCLVVWFEHGRVFRASGYARAGFLAETFWEFGRLDNAIGRGPVPARIPEVEVQEERSSSDARRKRNGGESRLNAVLKQW